MSKRKNEDTSLKNSFSKMGLSDDTLIDGEQKDKTVSVTEKSQNSDMPKSIDEITFDDKKQEKDKNLDNVINDKHLTQNDKTENEKSKAKKIWDIVAWTLTGLLLAIVLFFVILLIIGYRPAVVLTPSMKPAIDPGDLIIYKAVDAETIEVGDIITFWPSADDDTNELSVTHRVIEIIADGDGTLTFITHGDANSEGSNERVAQEQVIGRVEFVVPWVGQLFLFVKNNILVVVFAIISIIILCYLLKYLYKSMKEKDNVKGNVQEDIDTIVNDKKSRVNDKTITEDEGKQNIKSKDHTTTGTSKNKKEN